MHNIQYVSGSGESCKYCCKCVDKIDKNNYFTVSKSSYGSLIWRENVLQNSKPVTYDKFQQAEQENKRNWKHLQGTAISINEVWHHILKYPEVITNLNFVMIKKHLLETRTGKSKQNLDNPININFTQYDDNVTNNSKIETTAFY